MIRWMAVAILALTACGTIRQPDRVQQRDSVQPAPVRLEYTVNAAPPEATAAVPVGDPAAGEILFKTFQPAAGIACSTCHRVDTEDRLIGPGLLNLAARAGTRVAGQRAEDYIRTSIVDTGAYVVEGYMDIMPKNWGRVFSEAELDDLTAYLMSLS